MEGGVEFGTVVHWCRGLGGNGQKNTCGLMQGSHLIHLYANSHYFVHSPVPVHHLFEPLRVQFSFPEYDTIGMGII